MVIASKQCLPLSWHAGGAVCKTYSRLWIGTPALQGPAMLLEHVNCLHLLCPFSACQCGSERRLTCSSARFLIPSCHGRWDDCSYGSTNHIHTLSLIPQVPQTWLHDIICHMISCFRHTCHHPSKVMCAYMVYMPNPCCFAVDRLQLVRCIPLFCCLTRTRCLRADLSR